MLDRATEVGGTLCDLSIEEAAPLLRERRISPVELVQAYLDRIAVVNPQINGYITVLAESALAAARTAETEIAAGRYRGPLHGIPYSLKDNYYTKGIRTTVASRVLWDWVPETDASLHERLRDAGAVLLGKNNTWEFGTGTGEDQGELPFPLARNPWNTAYFAAGSSSGTGASVGGRIAMFGLGSDTGGSVRAPSAVSGLFGLKPTYGRLSRSGILPNSFTFDAAGPLCRSARDGALVTQVLAGHDPRDPTSSHEPVPDYAAQLDAGVKGLRIGFIRRFHERDVPADAACVQALEAAADIFRRLGAEVVDIDVPFTVQDYRACVRLIGQAEALSIHEETFRTRHHLMGRALRDKFLGSISLSAAEFVRATRWRREIIERTDAAVRSCDAVLCGGSLHAVPLLNDEPATIAYMLDSPNCVFNVTGHPSAAVCAGLDARGLPMSIQIAARYFDEATVFRVAAAYEAATGSTKARAPLTAGTLPPPVRRAAAGVTVGAPDAEAAPSREAIAGILRRMKVERVDDAMIERAHALCVNATVMIARVPASVPNDRDPAHVLALPQGLP